MQQVLMFTFSFVNNKHLTWKFQGELDFMMRSCVKNFRTNGILEVFKFVWAFLGGLGIFKHLELL